MNFMKNNAKNMQQITELITPIYEDFNRFVYSIVRNKDIRDDVVQSSLLIACKNFKSLNDVKKFKSWLYTIGKREAFLQIGKLRKEVAHEDSILDYELQKKDSSSKMEENIENREITKYVREAINQLDDKYRDLVILHYYAELPLKEIAELMDENYNTIRSRMLRSKEAISKLLTGIVID